MRSLLNCLPTFPGLAVPGSRAPYPVWRDSTTKDVRFMPVSKKEAVRLYRRARDFDRTTSKPGHHGGAVGPTALKVLETLAFDFLNFRNGRLDPSYEAIAEKANLCRAAVAAALKRLKELGILHWVRRCAEAVIDGRFTLTQETNAYAILPPTQWRGYDMPPDPPPPDTGTWGDHPPLLPVIDQAAACRKLGDDPQTVIKILESDPTDTLAAALARLGKLVAASGKP